MLFPQRRSITAAIYLVFLVPALHPLLLPFVGVPSHLLWFVHVLPVAWSTYHRGWRGGLASVLVSLGLLAAGERWFGAGYFIAADWQTVGSLVVALGFTNALVAGFADYARRARSLQELLWHSQKMETLGLFAASVAHDFSNMLTAITLSAELALEDDESASARRQHVLEIQNSAERAALLSKRLLAFSRRDVPQATALDLGDALSDLGSMLRRLVPSRVELRIASDTVPLILCDRGHIDQIVLNLVVNASDAIPERGTVTVTTRLARPHELPEGPQGASNDYVLLEVSDTGVGMDAALQRRIFDPLFTTKAPGKGTGLGLSTVRDLVTAWHGFVTVTSTVGHGSVFRVFLPVPLAAPGAPAPVASNVREPRVRLAS